MIPLQYTLAYLSYYHLFILFVPIYLYSFLTLRMVLNAQTKGFFSAAATVQWAVMLTVFNISHIVYLINLDPKATSHGGPVGLVLYLLILTQLNDVLQYIFGKFFGRHSIVPQISPNKTWEGFIGGFFSTILLSVCIAGYLTPMNPIQSILFGAMIAVGGFFGDITISSIKRDLKIKDTGTLLPGHGGILDRIDSLIFTSPIFFHSFYYFCL